MAELEKSVEVSSLPARLRVEERFVFSLLSSEMVGLKPVLVHALDF